MTKDVIDAYGNLVLNSATRDELFWTHYDLGRFGRGEEALINYTIALALSGVHDGQVLFGRGNTYADMEQDDKALADYTRAIELGLAGYHLPVEGRARLYRRKGENYQALGDFTNAGAEYDKALADYTKLIRPMCKDEGSFSYRGEMYQRRAECYKALDDPRNAEAEYDKALADYTKAIELSPERGELFGRRGQTYQVMGRYMEALADWNKALKLNDTLDWIRRDRDEVLRLVERILRSARGSRSPEQGERMRQGVRSGDGIFTQKDQLIDQMKNILEEHSQMKERERKRK